MISLREKLNGSSPTFGTWISIANALSAEIIGQTGYDWVIIDTQHGGVSEPQLLPLLQALDGTGTPALVRINWLDPAMIMRAADLGAAGVVVPMINTGEDARKAVQAIRYPPQGTRSFGRVRGGYGAQSRIDEPLCFVMIETAEALSNLEAIAATPALDGLLVGPVDLALSLGLGLSFEPPKAVLDAIEQTVAACRRHGLIAASVAFDTANAAKQIERGIRFLAIGSDTLFMRRAAAQQLADMRSIGHGREETS